MELFTKAQHEKLLANGRASAENQGGIDHQPVVKLFNPCGAATWLLSEIDPNDPDIAFGLCDLGYGTPEIGNVSISEIKSVKGPLGLGIERDLHFTPKMKLTEYADKARAAGRISA